MNPVFCLYLLICYILIASGDSLGTNKESAVLTEEEIQANITLEYLKNPCLSRLCNDGKMCIVIDNSTEKSLEERTSCVCPSECDGEVYQPICTVEGNTFTNPCQLYMRSCAKQENIEVAYEGECVVKKGSCTSQEFSEFAPRFVDWMLMVRQEFTFGEANMKTNMIDLSRNDQQHVVEWMFDYVDVNKDSLIDAKESRTLIMYLKSVERCVKEFVVACDTNFDQIILMDEWKRCLLPGSNTVEDDFLDQI